MTQILSSGLFLDGIITHLIQFFAFESKIKNNQMTEIYGECVTFKKKYVDIFTQRWSTCNDETLIYLFCDQTILTLLTRIGAKLHNRLVIMWV